MATLMHHFQEGGWGMYPILLFQILAIGIIVERAIYVYKCVDQQGRLPGHDAEVHPRR